MKFVVGSLIVGTILVALEHFFPERREQRHLRAHVRTDLAYWVLAPLVNRVLVPAVAFGAIVVTTSTVPRPASEAIAAAPLWAQALGMLVIGDFVGYWIHRLFHHQPWLWKIHAVHHSSEELDWLSSVRVHPLNQIIQISLRVTVLYVIGFTPGALAAYAPFLTFLAILIHANVPWRFGPLGFAIASPAWHRWHHAADALGEGRNFAGLLPVWDYLFGTAHFPREAPESYGLREEVMPDGIWRQLLHPFRASPGVEGPELNGASGVR